MTRPAAPSNVHALAIETSGRCGSVALGRGGACLEERSFGAAMKHATELLPTIDGLCRAHGIGPAGVSVVFVSGGPGSFTGLRVGVVCTRMLALGVGASVARVPTLEVIAQNALTVEPRPARVVVLLDAKRGRVYAGSFEYSGGRFVPVDDAAEVDPRAYCAGRPDGSVVMGEGVGVHAEAVRESGLAVLPESLNTPTARTVLALGWERVDAGTLDDPRTLIPIYVRRPEAEEVWERTHARDTRGGAGRT